MAKSDARLELYHNCLLDVKYSKTTPTPLFLSAGERLTRSCNSLGTKYYIKTHNLQCLSLRSNKAEIWDPILSDVLSLKLMQQGAYLGLVTQSLKRCSVLSCAGLECHGQQDTSLHRGGVVCQSQAQWWTRTPAPAWQVPCLSLKAEPFRTISARRQSAIAGLVEERRATPSHLQMGSSDDSSSNLWLNSGNTCFMFIQTAVQHIHFAVFTSLMGWCVYIRQSAANWNSCEAPWNGGSCVLLLSRIRWAWSSKLQWRPIIELQLHRNLSRRPVSPASRQLQYRSCLLCIISMTHHNHAFKRQALCMYMISMLHVMRSTYDPSLLGR